MTKKKRAGYIKECDRCLVASESRICLLFSAYICDEGAKVSWHLRNGNCKTLAVRDSRDLDSLIRWRKVRSRNTRGKLTCHVFISAHY
jgi:hypothetical protein